MPQKYGSPYPPNSGEDVGATNYPKVDTHHLNQLPEDLAPMAVTEIVDHHSGGQPEAFPNATIQNVHHQMQESAGRRGYVFRYTSMDLVLMEQLGIERQDRQISFKEIRKK